MKSNKINIDKFVQNTNPFVSAVQAELDEYRKSGAAYLSPEDAKKLDISSTNQSDEKHDSK